MAQPTRLLARLGSTHGELAASEIALPAFRVLLPAWRSCSAERALPKAIGLFAAGRALHAKSGAWRSQSTVSATSSLINSSGEVGLSLSNSSALESCMAAATKLVHQ